jgi:hypothetical protein
MPDRPAFGNWNAFYASACCLKVARSCASSLGWPEFQSEIDSRASQDQFWHDSRRKLVKLRRLNQRVWLIEIMINARIAKPVPSSQSPRQPQRAAS